jgi:hypothetical protein
MANYVAGRALTFITDVELRTITAGVQAAVQTNLFRIVSVASSTANPTGRKVVLTTSATDANVIGVLNEVKAATEPVSVVARNAQGTFKVVVSANSSGVAIGDRLTASSDSGAITTTTTGDQVIGIALEAGVAGQVIEYLAVNFKY